MLPPSLKVCAGAVAFRSATVCTGNRNQIGNQSFQPAGWTRIACVDKSDDQPSSLGTGQSATQSPLAFLLAVNVAVRAFDPTVYAISNAPLPSASARSNVKRTLSDAPLKCIKAAI